MMDLNQVIYRQASFYNNAEELAIKAVYGHYIVSEDDDIYTDTLSLSVKKPMYRGTPLRLTTDVDGVKSTIIRYEMVVPVQTVFTGENALQNAALHYDRLRSYLKAQGFTDMSLLSWADFTDASIFFEDRYLIRYQAEPVFLVFFDVTREEDYMVGVDELLEAYSKPIFIPENLLTTRTIEVNTDV